MQDLKLLDDFYKLIAPKIIKTDFTKKILALQMFSNPMVGEKFHILMIGEVAAAKSELLNFISDACPRGTYCSKDSTPAGILEKIRGADGGIVAVDELDKINKQVRERFLECMATQTVTMDQYGLHAKYQARINVLAACNPKNSILAPQGVPLHMQTPFGLPLLSRFHLLIPFRAISSEFYGDIGVSHNQDLQEAIDLKRVIMERLIQVKRQVPSVVMSDQMSRKCGEFVCDLKQISPLKEIISPRTIEGFVSCVKARTRMQLKTNCSESEFKYAQNIFNEIYF